MPVQTCRENGHPGYKGGPTLKCYTYPAGNDSARREAKRKAIIQGVAVERRRGRQSLTGEQFTALAHQAASDAEREHLPKLTAIYQDAIRQLADAASKRFAVVAAADWQPPPEGWVITGDTLALVAANMNERVVVIYRELIVEVGREPLARVQIDWTLSHPLARALLDKAARRTGARLGEAVQPVLREIVRDAYAEGLNVRDTAARIRAAIGDAAPWQAEMLARTDLNSLANGASKAAAGEAGMGFKTWVATLDDKTRREHADAHGDTVPIEATFLIGGEEAEYPGDPNLSDAMAANCRCTLAYGGTLDEAEGLLADGGGIIMDSMATTRQRAKRQKRRAARHKPETAITAAAIGVHHTATVEGDWDGNAAMTRATTAAEYRAICAWRDSNGDPNERSSYKFPHHASAGGPANMAGVRNALARLPQASIPSGDRAGVERHLRAHLEDHRRRQGRPAMVAAPGTVRFKGVAAVEGILTDDNGPMPRVILARALSWEPPVPFLAQTKTAEGHEGAEVAGRIDKFKRVRGETAGTWGIEFEGELTTPFGIQEIAPMIDDETLRGISVDLGATEWAIIDRDTFDEIPESELSLEEMVAGKYALGCKSAKIRAATLVPVQAIEGATVALAADASGDWSTYHETALSPADDALVASPAPARPPREWFETPEPPGKMPLTVTEDGRVYGHLATWDSCHVAFLPSCVPPPRSHSQYAYFHVCELDAEDGQTLTVGKLMFSPGDGGHADRGLTAQKAAAYYDRTGMAAAYLRVADGEHGIWAAGSLNPGLSDEQRKQMRRELRLHPPSGDWRPINGEYELICALAVAVPGFPTPRAGATVTVIASAEGIELQEAIIASSGHFEPDEAAVVAMGQLGLVDEELEAERRMRALAARAEGIDALAALID